MNDAEGVMISAVKDFLPMESLKVTFNGEHFIDSVAFKTLVI